ncbi:Hypothetical predicted protein, partial [Mytilus galloprovincialis]
MGADNSGSVGSVNNQRRLQTGVSAKTSFSGNKKDSSQYKKFGYFKFRNKFSFGKRGYRKSTSQRTNDRFLQYIILVPKKNGQMRPVINLKPLNQYLRKQHFKMDTISKVLNLVKQGDWAISLDLKDAYFHIKVFKNHRKYLRFSVQGQVYQFKALCFGPTSSPRVFTKVVSVVAAHLRKQNIRLAVYLDDWMCVNQFQQKLVIDREIMLNLLVRLGFLINHEKSSLIPNQTITYLGAVFKFDQGLVLPTQDRIQSLFLSVQKVMNGMVTARHYMEVLGKMASCLELIPNARLFMRPVQLHLLRNWTPSKMSLDFQIQCTPNLKVHLKWWLSLANIMQGRSLKQNQTSVTITTDASKS